MIGVWIPVIVAVIAAVGSFVTSLLNRKWQKEDRKNEVLTSLSNEVKGIQTTLNAHIEESELRDILQTRRRIIDFADECRRGTKHSEEHFNNVLQDITEYERYCKTHENFENRQAVSSISFVISVYEKCRDENSFI